MIAYFDCFSGISGDMTLGALLHLGTPRDWLEQSLFSLPLSGFRLETTTESRMGIHGQRAHVIVQDHPAKRDHGYIKNLIAQSPLSAWVKEKSLAVFGRLAEAEAKIHGISPEHVHFHELGGTDAIVDIVGAMLCLEHLGITRVLSSPLPQGQGFVTCAHGTLPVPAPATLELLKGCPTYGTNIMAELVTPTGAAIISTLAEGFGPMPLMTPHATGYGVGTHKLTQRPNCLRVVLGAALEQLETDSVLVLETSIDDMNPEIFSHVRERLFAQGALDVIWIPVYMKKDRPGTLIQVLCGHGQKDVLIRTLLSETTTLGVRFYPAQRQKLSRKAVVVETPWGPMQAKSITGVDGTVRIVPEYDACRKIALEKSLPLTTVYEAVSRLGQGRA